MAARLDGFERVVAMKGPKADQAITGRPMRRTAPTSARTRSRRWRRCSKKAYPKSRSLEEARALEMDIRNAGGQTVAPAAIQDEDLKLYALQALAQQENPAQAVPLLEKTPPRREQREEAARAGRCSCWRRCPTRVRANC